MLNILLYKIRINQTRIRRGAFKTKMKFSNSVQFHSRFECLVLFVLTHFSETEVHGLELHASFMFSEPFSQERLLKIS